MSIFGHYFPKNHNEAGELETLQTDVMRFLAIISLCLAAIFSLVQTVSVAPVKPNLSLVNRDALVQQIDQLLQRKQALTKELVEIQEQLQLTRRTTEQATRALQVADNTVNGQRRKLAAIQRELLQSGQRLQQMKNATASQTLAAVRQQVVTETYRLDRTEAQVRQTRADRPPQPSGRSTDTSRGLTLGFASVDALRQLIQRGDVVFYARAGGEFWRLDRVAPPAYAKSRPPRAYYEMVGVTIPPEFVSSFNKAVVSGASGTSWGVTLSPAIKQQLDAILAKAKDGEILIRADGSVRPPRSSAVQP